MKTKINLVSKTYRSKVEFIGNEGNLLKPVRIIFFVKYEDGQIKILNRCGECNFNFVSEGVPTKEKLEYWDKVTKALNATVKRISKLDFTN